MLRHTETQTKLALYTRWLEHVDCTGRSALDDHAPRDTLREKVLIRQAVSLSSRRLAAERMRPIEHER